jgi:hypothetical protein
MAFGANEHAMTLFPLLRVDHTMLTVAHAALTASNRDDRLVGRTPPTAAGTAVIHVVARR